MTSRVALGALVSSVAAASPAYVIHVLADDLGYNDMGYTNGQSQTPFLDKLASDGIKMPDFYVYKMCAPSRGTILTGRYPMHLGMYNNNGLQEGIHLGYQLLPSLLKDAEWSSHALGKWHLGWFNSSYLPTSRGFDTFFGSSGNTEDYWAHTISGPSYGCDDDKGKTINEWRDFIDCNGPCRPEDTAAEEYFGEYDTRVLTNRAMDIVEKHDTSKGLYIYLAYHNVHKPASAPCDTVAMFEHTDGDMRKVTDASLLEVDWGVGNISKKLESRGMLDSTLFIFHTDNGGPASHACNYPFRGGKFSFWEGGVRGLAFVSGGLLPKEMQGTEFQGLAHISDWYVTIAEGIAGVKIPAQTGPQPPAGVNLWPALTAGKPSPRTEVLHLPLPNEYVDTTMYPNGKPCADGEGCSPSIRVGDYKLIQGWPGDDGLCHLKPLMDKPVPYGKSKGTIEGDHCTNGKWDPQMTSQKAKCKPFCLFNVKEDPSEDNDLSGSDKKEHLDALKTLQDRLKDLSKTGMPSPDEFDKNEYNKKYRPQICAVAVATGFWLPMDFTPAPSPAPDACEEACEKACPKEEYSDYHSCVRCTKKDKKCDKACKPKARKDFCNRDSFVQLV